MLKKFIQMIEYKTNIVGRSLCFFLILAQKGYQYAKETL